MKARPLSEGSFNVGAVFQDEERCGSLVDEGEARPRTESEIASLLEQVALGSKTSRGTKDDMASLPPRKLNFFSSLRIKRVEGAEQSRGERQKDILSILSRFRNKASAQQQQQQESNSSSEDEQEPKLTHSGALQKKKRKNGHPTNQER